MNLFIQGYVGTSAFYSRAGNQLLIDYQSPLTDDNISGNNKQEELSTQLFDLS